MKQTSLFAAWLSARWLVSAVLAFCAAVSVLIFWLYDLPVETAVYMLCLCLVGTALFSAVDYVRFWRKHKILEKIREEILITNENLPKSESLLDEDYMALIQLLYQENRRRKAQADEDLSNLVTYYTLWVHQIKTPIAAMRLLLQSGEGDRKTELEIELLKISQYVDMVLQYLRLDSQETDFVLGTCRLDEVIRQTIRKYAKLFILNKIRLDFQETGAEVLSDEKWLSFLVEQILSNALKYTPKGAKLRFLWMKNKRSSLQTQELALRPKICPECLRRDSLAAMDEWIKKPQESVFISAVG